MKKGFIAIFFLLTGLYFVLNTVHTPIHNQLFHYTSQSTTMPEKDNQQQTSDDDFFLLTTNTCTAFVPDFSSPLSYYILPICRLLQTTIWQPPRLIIALQ